MSRDDRETPEEPSDEEPPKRIASESLTQYMIKLSLAALLEVVKYYLTSR